MLRGACWCYEPLDAVVRWGRWASRIPRGLVRVGTVTLEVWEASDAARLRSEGPPSAAACNRDVGHAGEHRFKGGVIGADKGVGGGHHGQRFKEHVEQGAGGGGQVAAAHHGGLDGAHLREGVAEGIAIYAMNPRGVDRRPADLSCRSSSVSRSAASWGTAGNKAPKQSELKEDPRAIVDEAGGDRIVVDGRLHGRQPSVADGHRLSGVDEVDSVQGHRRRRQSHDADAEET